MTDFPNDPTVPAPSAHIACVPTTLPAPAPAALASKAAVPRPMDLEAAMSVARRCRDEESGEDDYDEPVAVARVKAACIRLAAETTAATNDALWSRAALLRMENRSVSGHGARLDMRRDGGGHRHFLDGEAVHAGDGLELMTASGWLRIRYEWSFNKDALPFAYAVLPGVDSSEICFRIPLDALLARPMRR